MKMNDKFTDLVGQLIYGVKVRGYGYLSITDIRELYRVWQQLNCGNKPEFINANVKRVLDKFKIATEPKGVGWVCT